MPALAATCASRGCTNPLPPGRWTKCVSCLMGGRAQAKLTTQLEQVAALPPLVAAGGWGIRMPGSPRSWNNALGGFGRRRYLQPWAREWKRALALCAVQTRPAGWPMDARYGVEIHSYFARASSDADGPVKLALDALTGCAWNDDRQVAEVRARKVVDPAAPRLEVIVRVVNG